MKRESDIRARLDMWETELKTPFPTVSGLEKMEIKAKIEELKFILED